MSFEKQDFQHSLSQYFSKLRCYSMDGWNSTKTKAKTCPWERRTPGNKTVWEATLWKRLLGPLGESETNVSQQCGLAAEMANSIQGCINWCTSSRSKEGIIPLLSTHWTTARTLQLVLGPHYRKDIGKVEPVQQRETRMVRAGALALWEESEGGTLAQLREETAVEGPSSRPLLPIGKLLRRWSQDLHSSVWQEDELQRA